MKAEIMLFFVTMIGSVSADKWNCFQVKIWPIRPETSPKRLCRNLFVALVMLSPDRCICQRPKGLQSSYPPLNVRVVAFAKSCVSVCVKLKLKM